MPFEQAQRLVGDAALLDAGTSAKGNKTAYGNWKGGPTNPGRGVPWYIVGPLILKQHPALFGDAIHTNSRGRLAIGDGTKAATTAGTDLALPEASEPRLRRAKLPSPLTSAQDRVARIFFHFKPGSKQWQAVLDILDLAEPEADAAKPGKPSKSGAQKRDRLHSD